MAEYKDLTDDQRAQACADAFRPLAEPKKDLSCKKCGKTSKELLCLAMLETLGAKCYPASDQCVQGGEHELS